MYRLFIIIILVITIGYVLYINNSINEGMENEATPISVDEAIKNIASLYNKDDMIITNLNVTDTTKTNSLILGDKWKLTAGEDGQGQNDDWLRFLKADGSRDYYGGIAVSKLYDSSAGGQLSTLISGINSQITNTNNRINGMNADKEYPERWIPGWDTPGYQNGFKVSSKQDCINQCKARPHALGANFRNDNNCWCKVVKTTGTEVQRNHTHIMFGDR